jgi:hypothetical protein
MRKHIQIIVIFIGLIILGAISACSQDKSRDNNAKQKDKIIVDSLPEKGIMLVGNKKQVEGTKKSIKELIDPADDIAINAWELYKQKKYNEAEKEALRAISEAKQHIVKFSAHNTLLDIYEVTNNYDAAIKEIDWLLRNVNEPTKIGLIEKKKRFEKLLQKSSKEIRDGSDGNPRSVPS